MATRQAPVRSPATRSPATRSTATRSTATDSGGRAGQRRRTRAAIVEATTRLVAGGAHPSVDDIAAAADVSRRTVYLHFPTLDQLLLDAALGALSAATFDAALDTPGPAPSGGTADSQPASVDAGTRVDALVRALTETAATTLPLGRRIIKLTVDAGATEHPEPGAGQARRGYRRIAWLERAVEPLAGTLSAEQHERLVSALAIVIGFEAMIVLRDVAGLAADREEEVLRWAAASLVRAMVDERAG